MKIFKLAATFLFCMFLFTGCIEKEDIPDYHLNIISPSIQSAYDYYKPSENDENKYVLRKADSYAEFINEETIKDIVSVTVCDENITAETAQSIADICKSQNIPLFFLMKDVEKEILDSYDKCYCISADYLYIGEQFARKVNEMWQNEIIDKNGDQIFAFSIVKPETLSTVYQNFYDAFLLNIELLGIPLHQLEEIFLTKGDVLSYCESNKTTNEGIIILDNDYLSVFPENYTPDSSGIEILGISFGTSDIYRNYPYMKLCFIDYAKYFEVKNLIMENISNRIYPFENLDYSITDKYIYIQPTI